MKRKEPSSAEGWQICAPTTSSSSTGRTCSGWGMMGNNHNNSGRRTQAAPPRDMGEQLLVQEMNDMTMEERQKVYEEIHGVDPPNQEEETSPNQIKDWIQQMQENLVQSKRKPYAKAYEKANFLMPSFVQDEGRMLDFLRCDYYDPVKAAVRYCKFFEFRQAFYGMQGLVRDLTLADVLSFPEDAHMMNMATLQPLLDVQDHRGRPILLFSKPTAPVNGFRAMLRVYHFICMQAIQDARADKKSFVLVSWQGGSKAGHLLPFTPALVQAGSLFYSSLPLRFSALHFCYDHPAMGAMLELIRLVIGQKGRVRFRAHHGSPTELLYALMSFGIPVQDLPLDDSGNVTNRPMIEWIEHLQEQENQKDKTNNQSSDSIVIPTERDVLLGRGQPYRTFAGNQALAKVVERHWQEYQALPRHLKTQYMQAVTHKLVTDGGVRFLQRCKDDDNPLQWEVVSLEKAQDKVAHTFRNKPVVERYHESQRNKSETG